MRKINDKNLRRKVQKQLKELRGRVGQKAVDHGLMVKGEGLMVNDEGQSLNPHPSTLVIRNSNFELRPQHSLNSHPSTLNSTEVSDEEKIVNCDLSIVNCDLSIVNSKHPSLPELERFIRRDYDLRYNVLSEQTEYRRRDDMSGEFHPATQRVYRTWLTDLQREGVEFWKIDGLRTAI